MVMDLNLVFSKILDRNGLSHARIDSCTQFWFIHGKIRKIQLAKWSKPTKNTFKKAPVPIENE
jgi:hypothetical protein